MKKLEIILVAGLLQAGCGATPPKPRNLESPALEYSQKMKQQLGENEFKSAESAYGDRGRVTQASYPKARASFVDLQTQGDSPVIDQNGEVVTNMPQLDQGVVVEESKRPLMRDYNGPLSLGDPGVQASLWREGRRDTRLFQDFRAWQPMDILTITLSEVSQGSKDADTAIKTESSIEATFEALLGIPQFILGKIDTYLTKDSSGKVDTSQNLVKGGQTSEYSGEGQTTRKGSLTGNIAAVVVEVLPSGVLRVEGKKIISVNNEDETMVISGLVRPVDINSANEVSSTRIAQLRVDYYGDGSVGDAQQGGWAGNAVRKYWPF